MSLHRRILLSSDSNGPDLSSGPPPSSHQVPSHVIIAAVGAVVAFLFLALIYYVVLRHRRRRPPPTTSINNFAASDVSAADHPIWHIKTLGLDPTAIDSLGSYVHLSAAHGTSADCSVCLAEVLDGETVRLLPKCSHVFHVQCIDTWLSSHVTCPLCRAGVVDAPAADVAAADVDAIPVESPPLDGEEEGGENTRVSIEVPESSSVLRSNSVNERVLSMVDEEKEGNSSNSLNLEKGQSEIGMGFLLSRLGRTRSSS